MGAAEIPLVSRRPYSPATTPRTAVSEPKPSTFRFLSSDARRAQSSRSKGLSSRHSNIRSNRGSGTCNQRHNKPNTCAGFMRPTNSQGVSPDVTHAVNRHEKLPTSDTRVCCFCLFQKLLNRMPVRGPGSNKAYKASNQPQLNHYAILAGFLATIDNRIFGGPIIPKGSRNE